MESIIQDLQKRYPMLDSVPFLRSRSSFLVDVEKQALPVEMSLNEKRDRMILCYPDGIVTIWNLKNHVRDFILEAPFKGACKLMASADGDHTILLPCEHKHPIIKINLDTGKIVKQVAFHQEKKQVDVPKRQNNPMLTLEQNKQLESMDKWLQASLLDEHPDRILHSRVPRNNKIFFVTEGRMLNLYTDSLERVFTKENPVKAKNLAIIGQEKVICPIFEEEKWASYKYHITNIAEIGDLSKGSIVEIKDGIRDEAFQLSQDGRLTIHPYWSHGIHICDTESGTCEHHEPGIPSLCTPDIVISNDDTRAFRGGMIGLIWNLTARTIDSIIFDSDLDFIKGAFMGDKHLVTVSRAKMMKIWDLH
jgi:hypothetical protein